MTKFREILRLTSMGLSQRSIMASCGVAQKTVVKVQKRARELNLTWPLDESFTDSKLQKMMFSQENTVSTNKRMPDFAYIRKELLRNGVSKKLLWTEYMEDCRANGEEPLMYSQFCYHIQQDEQKRRATIIFTTIEIFYNHNRIASHRRLKGRMGQYSTITEHMPQDHQDYLEWNSDRFRKWAERIGINTYTMVNAILTSKGVEQQTYRSCMGLLKLTEKYSEALVEAACKKALSYTTTPSYKSIKNILVTGSEKLVPETTDTQTTHKAHGITRGADYYRR